MTLALRVPAILLAFLCLLGPARAQVAFDVPEKMEFAGMKLRLDESARRAVQSHGQNLVKNNKFYRSMTERADAYLPIIERVFREEGLPDDFKFLCIQESGLTSDVVSSSKAVGYWQFKAETATDFGLRVDPEVDERMNILASSRAAARYLVKNNQYLNNWVHALISYYSGLGGAKMIVDNSLAGSREMDITGTTHFYVLKFLAHKLAFEQVVNRSPNPALQVMEYDDCEGKTLRQIASETNVPMDQIEFYNKWCRAGLVPADKNYAVMIPVKSDERPSWTSMQTRPTPQLGDNLKPWREKAFFGLIEKDPVPADPANAQAPIFLAWNGIKAILARKEDNINKLALASEITRDEFMEYNDLRVFDLIVPGQVYYVKAKRKKARVPFHTSRMGESLWEVAQNYGVTLKALLRKNRMNSVEKLTAGRILWLRHTRPEDHPIEYDPNVQRTPTVPVSEPILAKNRPPATAVASADETSIVTAPNTIRGASPAYEDVKEKYADVPALDTDTVTATPLPENIAERVEVTAPKPAGPAPVEAAPPAPAYTRPAAPTPSPEVRKAAVAYPALVHKPGYRYHTVETSQTLYAISRQYQVPADSLRAWNQLPDNNLRLGMELEMKPAAKPAQAAPAASQPGIATHTVQPGETFYKIARQYHLTAEQLKALNSKTDFNLSIGEILRTK